MTDTARTLAEIQSLLTNNTSGGISPQDLRDTVQSIITPISGGGMEPEGAVYARTWSTTVGKNGVDPVFTLEPDEYYAMPFGTLSVPGAVLLERGVTLRDDDYSLSGSDPDSAWGVDVLAGDTFMLPTGLYFATTVGAVSIPDTLNIATDTLTPFYSYFDQVRYDSAWTGPTDGSAPWFYDGFYNAMAWNYSLGGSTASGDYRAVEAVQTFLQDNPDPEPFTMYMGLQAGRAAAIDLTYYYFSVVRIG